MRKKRECCRTYAGHQHEVGCFSVDAIHRMYLTVHCHAPRLLCEVCRERFCFVCMNAHAHLKPGLDAKRVQE
jgi:hypothetical protein